jgi:hypothetical protein
MRLARHVARVGKEEARGKETTRKTKTELDLLDIGWGGVDRIGLAQDRDKWKALVNAIMNLRVPQNSGKLSRGFTTGGPRVVLSSMELTSCLYRSGRLWGPPNLLSSEDGKWKCFPGDKTAEA